MISSTAFFDLREQLSCLRKLGLQEGIGLKELVALSHSKVAFALDLIEGCDFDVGFVHFLSALLAELVVMSSKKRHLLEQNMILLSKQMDALSAVVIFVLAIGVVVAGHIGAKGLQVGDVDAGFFDQSEVFTLLDLEAAYQFFVL